ncbi:hypothetical protein [Nitrosomonas sp. PY1]|uniref:hypothetical protein n=1 Tax=Nitrosomonas sp. PY1 TaxID=1803906 RepID=UPI001FC89DF2|nr:hypothetical protein [Nitrosomonas sp. PY1]
MSIVVLYGDVPSGAVFDTTQSARKEASTASAYVSGVILWFFSGLWLFAEYQWLDGYGSRKLFAGRVSR